MRSGKLRAIAVAAVFAACIGSAAAAACGNDASGFKQWVEDFKSEATSAGISGATADSALSGLKYSTATITRSTVIRECSSRASSSSPAA